MELNWLIFWIYCHVLLNQSVPVMIAWFRFREFHFKTDQLCCEHICQWGFQWPQFVDRFNETAHLTNFWKKTNLHKESVLHERFSALHVFITLSTIKHDQQLFFTLTEPTTNKNDFHHHIDLDTGSIMPRFVSGKITCGVIFYDMKIYVCKSVCDF